MLNSTDSKDTHALKLRAHHICCIRFAKASPEGRTADFYRAESRIKDVLLSELESLIMVVEGADELCPACPLCVNGRCISPLGDEGEVRKWDAILLRELGVSYGDCLTAGEWQALIEQKTPFKICMKCKGKEWCSVGARLL